MYCVCSYLINTVEDVISSVEIDLFIVIIAVTVAGQTEAAPLMAMTHHNRPAEH